MVVNLTSNRLANCAVSCDLAGPQRPEFLPVHRMYNGPRRVLKGKKDDINSLAVVKSSNLNQSSNYFIVSNFLVTWTS